jgi:pimeloyl-ACP methyl ester carboxylesterase
MADWVDEIGAVASAAGLRRPVLLGHSMGGRAALTTAVRNPALVRAVVCIDTPLDRGRRSGARPADPVEVPVYATAEEAVARFRTRPRTDGAPEWVIRHVARGSVRPVLGGWTWKADQGVFGRGESVRDLLPRVAVPVVLLRGEHGLVPPAMAAEMRALAPAGLTAVELPDCGHHAMLEAPLSLLAALRTVLAVWPGAADRRADT